MNFLGKLKSWVRDNIKYKGQTRGKEIQLSWFGKDRTGTQTAIRATTKNRSKSRIRKENSFSPKLYNLANPRRQMFRKEKEKKISHDLAKDLEVTIGNIVEAEHS